MLCGTGVEVNALTANGFTTLDILAQSERHINDWEIGESLRDAGAVRAVELPLSLPKNRDKKLKHEPVFAHSNTEKKMIKHENWLSKKRDSLMVVASLIATMAFQAATTPPGGFWQEDTQGGSQASNNSPERYEAGSPEMHIAGSSIAADKDQTYYSLYLFFNTTSFIASLSVILLLITGLPFTRRLFMWILTVTVWVAITAIALTYIVAVMLFTPNQAQKTVYDILLVAVKAWCGVMALLLVMHTIRLAANLLKKVNNFIAPKKKGLFTFLW